jgi:ABC-type transporter Mla subunit MlaD
MATKLTQAQSARIARRTSSDIKNLVRSYQTQFADVSGQYAKEFSDYQKSVADKMAPYEASVANYLDVVEPKYRAEVEKYNAALSNYQRKLAEIDADPVIAATASQTYRTWYGKKKTDTFEVFIPKEIPTFDAKMPQGLPDMPTAPEIEAFDSGKFSTQHKSVVEGLDREMSERRGARMNAVQRGRGRTLLKGT